MIIWLLVTTLICAIVWYIITLPNEHKVFVVLVVMFVMVVLHFILINLAKDL